MLFRCLFRFLKAYPKLKVYKTSALDPQRSKQAAEEVAVKFEACVNEKLRELRNLGIIDYDSLETCPIELKFNMDEVGVNGNVKRKGKITSTKLPVNEIIFMRSFKNILTGARR